MATAGNAAGRQKAPGMTGGWFWLAAAFAATLYLRFSPARVETVAGILADQAFAVAVAVVLWSLAGRILGAILRAAAPGPVPAWVFRLSGWMLVTLGAGALIALQAGDDPRAFARDEELPGILASMAALGLGWWLLIDLGRALLARLGRRSAVPFLSSASLAFVLGLAAIAWIVWTHRKGTLDQPPVDAGLAALGAVLAAGAVLTLLVELPRALLARRGAGPAEGLAATRARLTQQLQSRPTPRPAAQPATQVKATTARSQHGSVSTPPTVVRRR
jgi:hypothetical protein